MNSSEIELLSPAGSFETALAAFTAGANAVYLGLDAFSARADAVNFTPEQLRDLLAVAHAEGKKAYVTFSYTVAKADKHFPDLNVRDNWLVTSIQPTQVEGRVPFRFVEYTNSKPLPL